MRRPRGVKSIETKHYEERDAFFRGLHNLDRRSFLAGVSQHPRPTTQPSRPVLSPRRRGASSNLTLYCILIGALTPFSS
jgi:hypothetical protein